MATQHCRPELIALFIAAQACTVAVAEAANETAVLPQPTAAQVVELNEYSGADEPRDAMVCDRTAGAFYRF